ncbi:hypothetical protein BCEP27_50112 [Burkholderia cepacia]
MWSTTASMSVAMRSTSFTAATAWKPGSASNGEPFTTSCRRQSVWFCKAREAASSSTVRVSRSTPLPFASRGRYSSRPAAKATCSTCCQGRSTTPKPSSASSFSSSTRVLERYWPMSCIAWKRQKVSASSGVPIRKGLTARIYTGRPDAAALRWGREAAMHLRKLNISY